MQRLTRGLLASCILIVPTYLGVKFISEPSAAEFVAKMSPEERRAFESRALVTSKNLEHMIERSRSTKGRMTMSDFEGVVSYADQLKDEDPQPTGRNWPATAPGGEKQP